MLCNNEAVLSQEVSLKLIATTRSASTHMAEGVSAIAPDKILCPVYVCPNVHMMSFDMIRPNPKSVSGCLDFGVELKVTPVQTRSIALKPVKRNDSTVEPSEYPDIAIFSAPVWQYLSPDFVAHMS